jgi:parallel beta-helix repeat protein
MLTATLWVDPNVAPSGNIFAKIGDAVAVAHSGDTIKVVAGTYAESVDVTKSLSIIGGQVRTAGEPAGPSIVSLLIGGGPQSAIGFSLDANNITIRDFTLKDENIGIQTSASFSGYKMVNNTFIGDATGVEFANSPTSSAANTISGNKFFVGAMATTFDIHSLSVLRNLAISNNVFEAASTLEAVFLGPTSQASGVQILNNHLSNDAEIVALNLTKSKVDGNTVDNPISGALDLGVSNSEIKNNTLIRMGSTLNDAIDVTGNGNKILANVIAGFFNGVLLGSASQCTVGGNTIGQVKNAAIAVGSLSSSNTISSNTLVHSGGYGVLLQATGNTVAKNDISDGMGVGIDVHGSGGNDASGNTISGNTVSNNGAFGIEVDSDAPGMGHGNNNIISKNSVTENTNSGIYLNGASGTMVSGNTVNNNHDAGIVTVGATDSMLSHNTCNFNASEGIALEAASNSNTLSGNTNNFNGNDGVYLDASAENSLSNNIANRNQNDGFVLQDSSTGNTLSGNSANANSRNGFHVLSSSSTLAKNTANGNVAIGFFFEDGGSSINLTGITFQNNMAVGNQSHGLEVHLANNSIISGNKLLDNGGAGMDMEYSTATVSGNNCSGNAGDGILFFRSSDSSISGNTAMNNSGDGIHLVGRTNTDDTVNNKISGNTALGNGDAFGGFDLDDMSGDTTNSNTWTNNKAVTRNPANLG